MKQKRRNGESVVARGRWHFSLRKRREWRSRERTERRAELSGEAAVALTRVKGPCACIHHLCPHTAHPAPFQTDSDLGGDTRVWFSNCSDSLADPVLEGGVPHFPRRGPRSCVCLCVLRVTCCNGQKWTEKWNRTRGLQLGGDVCRAGNPASPGARTPRSRPR